MTDVRSALWYSHIMQMARGLASQTNREAFQELSEAPARLRPRGPAQTLSTLLNELGATLSQDFVFDFGIHGSASASELKKLGHVVREALRHRLITQIVTKRKNLNLDGHQVDLNVTTRYYRSQIVKFRAGLVALLCDGVLTRERIAHMHEGNTTVCSFCGHPREDIEHVLWSCPRWDEYRRLGPDVTREILSLPPAARRCSYALLGMTSRLAHTWRKYQEQASQIVELHQKMVCGDQRVPQPVLNLKNVAAPDDVPAIPSLADWERGVILSLTHTQELASQTHAWMYSRIQWNQMMHWMATLRRSPQLHEVTRISVLELYVSYVLSGGGARFASGLSEASHGSWWTTQLSQFLRAVRVMQAHVLQEALVPLLDSDAIKLDWCRHWHIPSQGSCLPGLMLPNHESVRRYLDTWSVMPHPVEDTATKGAELWRRQPLGTDKSQLSHQSLHPQQSLVWRWPPDIPRIRLRWKTCLPPWARAFYANQAWVNAVTQLQSAHPELVRLVQIASIEGTTCRGDLSRIAGKRTKRALLLRSLVSQNSKALDTASHVAIDCGIRVTCSLCGVAAPLSHTRVWFSKPCMSDRGGRRGVILSANEELSKLVATCEQDAATLKAAAALLP